ncbi:MAG: SGNH/GDSL hydrolase family protein [Solirubrobacteraceae bacterium]
MSHLRKLPLLVLLAGVLAIPASPATAKIQIGISDQSPHMFVNEWFAPLEIRYARIVVPYDILTRKDYWPEYLQLWLTNAEAAGVEPHVAFNIKSVETKYFGKGPTVRRYARIVRRFVKKYPTVRTYTPWNEANHAFQPTARRPRLAAGYRKAMRKACPTCKVLVADLLDDENLTSWLRKFKRYYKGRGTWGLHNYQDANKHRSFRTSWTYKLARSVKGDIWSTEAGGLVGFKTVQGRVAYKYSLSRQLLAQKYLFKLMNNRKVRHRYKRVYIYNFYGSWSKTRKTNRWDSGLISLANTPRPAYYDLKRRSAGG